MADIAFRSKGIAVVAGEASGDDAIMTRGTGTNYLAMIDTYHGRPNRERHSTMAVLAQVRGINMVGALARGSAAVVATDTTTNYLRMIHLRGLNYPTRTGPGEVAGLAEISHSNMTAGQRMASSIGTTAQYLVVIHVCRRPTWESCCYMTGLADVGAINVARVLTWCKHIIMTAGTYSVHFIVVHLTGQHTPTLPRPGQMAGLTEVRGVNV